MSEVKTTEQIEQKPKKKNGGARPNSGPKKGAVYTKTKEISSSLNKKKPFFPPSILRVYGAPRY